MNEPQFLTPEQVEGFHRRALELYGGLDGNKRTAVAAALTFLKLNGVDTRHNVTQPLLHALIAVTNRELDRDGLALLLRQLLAPK